MIYFYEPVQNKTNKMTVRPAKTQISQGICLGWSESSLGTVIFSSPEQCSGRAIVMPLASAAAAALAGLFANVKIFRTSLFPNHMMYLVHIWYDDRYWFKILRRQILTPLHDLKDKVRLRIFMLKFLEMHYFPTLWCTWFMFGMMIDIGPKFYTVRSSHPWMTLRIRSGT